MQRPVLLLDLTLTAFTVACVFSLAACPAPPDEDVDAGSCTPRPDVTICDSDRVCVGGDCERANEEDACGICVRLVCLDNGDCAAGQECDLERARCEPADACEVFDARTACGDEAGALCAPADELSQCSVPDVAACEIVPAVVMVNDGRAAIVEVLALDELGRPVPVSGSVVLPPSLATVASCAGPEPCRDVVTASVLDVSCTAPSIVLPDLTAGARIVVRDIDSGAPLAGASVVVDGATATSDSDGVALFPSVEGNTIEYARADAAGFETTVIVAPGTTDVEVLMARVPATGTSAGKLFGMDDRGLRRVGDIRFALGTLSAPDLVDALDGRTLAGPPVDSNVDLEGVTDPGGNIVVQPSATTMFLGDNPVFGAAVALGRPGPRLLSVLGAQVQLATVGPLLSAWVFDGDTNNDGDIDSDVNGDGVINDDDRVGAFDGVLGLWEGGQGAMAFGVAGTMTTTEATFDDEIGGGIGAFDDGDGTEVRPALDTTDELDVVVAQLADGDDAAFVALYARVPGRGFVLLALRFASDLDGDGLVDVPSVAPIASDELGVVRLFVAPSLWMTDRELVVVAGSQRLRDLRDGVLGKNRVSAPVTSMSAGRVALPAFRADTAAFIEGGALVTLTSPRAGGLLSLHGTFASAGPGGRGAPFRVLVGGDDATVDLTRYGIENVDEDDAGESLMRVWRIDATPTFNAGTLGVARALAAPASAVDLNP